MTKPIIAIVGPTASGKTDLGLFLAKELNGEIISADSMQVYEGLDIGTAKIKPEARTVPHHLIDVVKPDINFSVADYHQLAEKAILDIRKRGKRPIFVGGTGLYLQSVLDGLLFPEPNKDERLRHKLLTEAKELGNEYMFRRLLNCDKESARKIHPNDIRRIIRALEVYIKTGIPLSKLQEEYKELKPRYETIWIGITAPRDVLYQRIDKRVEAMLSEGLLEEVKKHYLSGLRPTSTAYQALGYKEMIWYLKGFVSYEEAVRILKRDTRHYAKRQLSWFRKDSRIKWLSYEDYLDFGNLKKAALDFIKAKDEEKKENLN